MDWTALLGSLISGIVALCVSVVNSNAQLRRADHEQDKRMIELQASFDKSIAVIENKMQNLTDEVREHNNFAKRMPVVEEQIKSIEKRLDALEKKGA